VIPGTTIEDSGPFRDCASCPEMVFVQAGSFRMGSPESEPGRWEDEGPRHVVTVAESLAVGVYEVSYAEWDACVADGGCQHRPDDYGLSRGNRPVTDVSWEDAQQFVSWLGRKTGKGYRLLSEAEWEYVARGGTNTARYWGEQSDRQCRYANGADDAAKQLFPDWVVVTCNDGYIDLAPVGTYEANEFGLHDVLGNVWEWTQDCWNDSYQGAPRDGSPWQDGYCGVAVVRGGSWSNAPDAIRSAMRAWSTINYRDVLTGLRVARPRTADDSPSPPPDRPASGGSPSGGGSPKPPPPPPPEVKLIDDPAMTPEIR
jgi:formylglycine-generating enzyme required for sulfatase activity